jgi:hypothetical protein
MKTEFELKIYILIQYSNKHLPLTTGERFVTLGVPGRYAVCVLQKRYRKPESPFFLLQF